MNRFLELSEQHRPVRVDIVRQAVTELAAAATDDVLAGAGLRDAGRRSAFSNSEFQMSFMDSRRTSPITSFRPQSRKQALTRPSAFTE